MKKSSIIFILLSILSLAVAAYNFVVRTGYWGTPILLSIIFYVIAILFNFKYHKIFLFMGVIYLLIGLFLLLFFLIAIGNVLGP
ncbi:hypothetical protein [Ornithinibacillus scapharcae]|uniref:hypothetical protein n=1 Tax=Ornithinibacillus scapharcae TaxID=1147159 RepID=UPI000225B9C1|nr:hypothetical protein [Ornithinibacillus scapharcae]